MKFHKHQEQLNQERPNKKLLTGQNSTKVCLRQLIYQNKFIFYNIEIFIIKRLDSRTTISIGDKGYRTVTVRLFYNNETLKNATETDFIFIWVEIQWDFLLMLTF